jgi:carbonic anhydrase
MKSEKVQITLFICVTFFAHFLIIKVNANNLLKELLSVPGNSKFSFSFKENAKNNVDSSTDNISSEIDKFPLKQEKNKILREGWLSISSINFKNERLFPKLPLPDGSITNIALSADNSRINEDFQKDNPNIPSQIFFYFKLNTMYLYYTSNKQSTMILNTFTLSTITQIEKDKDKKCFTLIQEEYAPWKFCSETPREAFEWICKLESVLGINSDDCNDPKHYENYLLNEVNSEIQVKIIEQPLIIIPLPAKQCNQNWDYEDRGGNWECLCQEGKEQSPIDLPEVKQSIESSVRPLFNYEKVDSISMEDNYEGGYKRGDKITLTYSNHSLRIFSNNLGKLVTVTGSVYRAEEIIFKTPSEHTINGERFNMEMQIIHKGISNGDFGKKAILSFLFQAKPGVYNRLLEGLDFFNLPNPIEKVKEITEHIYIPNIFLSPEDNNINIMPNFSFFTYQGSLTEPPCEENTIVYVASKPILTSVTVLELFREALRIPDREDEKGNIFISTTLDENYRNTQPLNGRPIFHYDHLLYNCPEFVENVQKKKNLVNGISGHYEKKEKLFTEYMFINGMQPSGIKDSYVVSEQEAVG